MYTDEADVVLRWGRVIIFFDEFFPSVSSSSRPIRGNESEPRCTRSLYITSVYVIIYDNGRADEWQRDIGLFYLLPRRRRVHAESHAITSRARACVCGVV